MRVLTSLLLVAFLAACGSSENETQKEAPVKGLRVFEVTQSASKMLRTYPSVIQPSEESKLSFEISGQLGEVSLEVGERVKAGDVLLQLDDTSLKLEVQQARAALEQAEASEKNARTDFERKAALLQSGNVTRAAYDSADTQLKSSVAQVEQARQQLGLSEEKLVKSTLKAPFSGVISALNVDSFNTVSPGNAVLTLYGEGTYEVAFNVPSTVINDLKVGDQTSVEVSDLNLTGLKGHIKELGSRAQQVSAFPVVVVLEDSNSNLKAGMPAEVEVSVNLIGGTEGFLVPIHCFVLSEAGEMDRARAVRDEHKDTNLLYVFDPVSSTVKAREVVISGVRGNMAIVTSGLNAGELIASAGVSYLSDGQKVRRLPDLR
ncbi:efflux RND transporter periplasmic adaptor subunit [Kordiimonas laminariae]|uniref:efflux RND transporter periplasmic adaptor subunit n=1 Tax=Kordiimonas laminariae TaxID=2917717 RepID=UPI001FF1FA2E|nr:efflux RND transporter periplasmic adaptor subunit [Kordiimonas laminariae]MCK0068277.1 efflux RND transporter periplasmic adaptor subunit [Kordiimonas laminariae]